MIICKPNKEMARTASAPESTWMGMKEKGKATATKKTTGELL